jgi:cytochrome c oxidase assembly factor CtaG
MLVSSLVLLFLIYAAGLVRVWRNAGTGAGISAWEASAFAGGWLALAVALSPPLDEWSDHYLVAHMAQHELLMAVAAPLITLSAPVFAFLWAFPPALRKRGLDALRREPIVSAWTTLTSPLSAFLLHFLALWIWHLPALYDYALEHEAAHAVQHLCFFGTAALFWWGIAHGRYGRAGYGAAVVYAFATSVHGGVLGALLTFSPRVWYTPYLVPHGGTLSPLEDQQLAGLLMWVPAGLVFVAGGLTLFAGWIRESERRARTNTSVASGFSRTSA